MQELVKLANAEEWETAIGKLNELLSEFGLRFDTTALSRLAKLSEEHEAPEDQVSDAWIAADQITTFANTSPENLEQAQQWLSNNGLDMSVAFFLRPKNLELQLKMIRELKIPIAVVRPPPLPSTELREPASVESELSTSVIKSIQQNLCVPPSGNLDPRTRDAIQQAKLGAAQGSPAAPFQNIEN